MSFVPQIDALIGGKYRISRELGAGGMGVVFEARHDLTDKRVALKLLRPEFAARPEHVRRMLREAQASARIRHPNVVDVFDVGSEEDTLFLVMEYLEGETLAARLARGVLSVGEALSLLVPAMRGVAAGHAHGIVHRDVKPENIFLAEQPDGAGLTPKVLDFGISKVPSLSGEDLRLTASGTTLGTPLYMSYEQLTGERDIDGRADVYAFGVILYQALTGHMPFDAETLGSLAVQVATTTPRTPSVLRTDLPPALDHVIMRAIARSREARYGSLDALVQALDSLTDDKAGLYAADTLPLMEAVPAATTVDLPSAPPRDSEEVEVPPASRAARSVRMVLWGTSLLVLAVGYMLLRSGASPTTTGDLKDRGVPSASTEMGVETTTDALRDESEERAGGPDLPTPESAADRVSESSVGEANDSTEASPVDAAKPVPAPSSATRRKQRAPKRASERSAAERLGKPRAESTSESAPQPTAPLRKTPLHRAGKPSLDEF